MPMVFPYMPFEGKSEKLIQNTGYFGLAESCGTRLLPSILTFYRRKSSMQIFGHLTVCSSVLKGVTDQLVQR